MPDHPAAFEAPDLPDLIERARRLATDAHAGQERRSGDPYITHPQRVAERVEGLARVVAWLHDVVEDTPVTLADLAEEGFPPEVVAAVDRLTKRDGESYAAFVERCAGSELAAVVKLADLADNLADLGPGARRDKYELAGLYLRHRLTRSA